MIFKYYGQEKVKQEKIEMDILKQIKMLLKYMKIFKILKNLIYIYYVMGMEKMAIM